jgi:nicotinate-nucleotide adenylyltransferase
VQSFGIFPGTFDPIHEGHLAFAQKALEVCMLDAAYFMAEAEPRSKTNVTDISVRYEQIQNAVSHIPKLNVLQLASPRFTVEATFSEIETHFHNAELTLLIGSDVAMSLPSWEGIAVLLARCNLAIGLRHGASQKNLNEMLHNLEVQLGFSPVARLIEADFSHVSSSQLRK